MQNKLSDLNNHLFEQLERLLDDDVCSDKEATASEIAKAKAVCDISQQIVNIANVQLNGVKLSNEWNLKGIMPKTLAIE